MNITVIYGQKHKGNTYKLTKLFLGQLSEGETQVDEFFLPDGSLGFCSGCLNCIMRDEKTCPHYAFMEKVTKAIDRADLIIVSSPCYVFSMTGQLKTLFDHFGYRYMAHRPEASMFRKQALALSTAAGAGMGKTAKLIAFNFFMWGVARIYKYGVRINAHDFNEIPNNRKRVISRKAGRITKKILKYNGRAKPNFKTRFMFQILKLNQRKNDWNAADKEFWQSRGWLDGKKPYGSSKKF